jgi:hypothetical protein
MSKKPEAIKLANILQYKLPSIECLERSAAELRRLQAENERLHQINQSHEMKLSVRGYEIQIKDLKAVNAELLQVVVDALEIFEFGDDDKTVVAPNWVARARAASRQWLLTEPLRRGEIMSIEALKQ